MESLGSKSCKAHCPHKPQVNQATVLPLLASAHTTPPDSGGNEASSAEVRDKNDEVSDLTRSQSWYFEIGYRSWFLPRSVTRETTIAEVILQLDPTSDISQMDVLIPHVRSYYDLRVFSKIDAFNLPRGNICKMMHLLMIRHLDTVRSTVLFIIRYELRLIRTRLC